MFFRLQYTVILSLIVIAAMVFTGCRSVNSVKPATSPPKPKPDANKTPVPVSVPAQKTQDKVVGKAPDEKKSTEPVGPEKNTPSELAAKKTVPEVKPNNTVDKKLNVNRIVMPDGQSSRFLSNDVFVTRWNILGPFTYTKRPENGDRLSDMVHEVFYKNESTLSGHEKAPENVSWQLENFKSKTSPGEIDLLRLYKKAGYAAAYAVTYLYTDKPLSNLILYCGSSSYIKVWINGQLVHTYNRQPRPGHWDQDVIKNIRLEKGYNQVVVKTVTLDGPWKFYFRLATENYMPLTFIPE